MPSFKTPHHTLLLVDDDQTQRGLLEGFLTGQGFNIATASGAREGLEILGKRPVDMVISDVRMPGMTGLELLHEIRATRASLPVMLVTAYADLNDAHLAGLDGAFKYLQKPVDWVELLEQVRSALDIKEIKEGPLADLPELPPGVIAESPQMRAVLREAAIVAPSDSRILISGESGVGKEVIADLIHRLSPRRPKTIVKVNCASIPKDLIESELFGHEKGAFTGAVAQRIGHFEQADGGTILLDEIGEMPLDLQVKLLRVCQDGTFRRIGDNRERKVDARILAATNRDLEAEVAAGRFREDLFFRLNVFEIHVPALRDRKADIMPLANTFAAKFAGAPARFASSAVACLELYDWPGNVRELRNAMERAALMSRGQMIAPEHLPPRVQAAAAAGTPAKPEALPVGRMEDVERSVILQTLRDNDFNRSESARVLGISRRALQYKLQRYREQGYAIESDGA